MKKILLFLGLSCLSTFSAQENLLDPNYGQNNGTSIFAFYTNGQPSGGLQIHDTTQLPDGKLLAVGASFYARFTANGLLDPTFNNGLGYKLISPAHTYNMVEPAGDGNYIVLDGSTGGQILKIDENGNSVNGFTTYNASGDYVDMHIDPSGKIYVIRRVSNNHFLVRLLPNGLVDTTFANNGEIALGSTYQYRQVKVNANNEIFIGGKYQIAQNNRYMLVSKFDSAGNLVTTFGTNGHFTRSAGEYVGDYTRLELLEDGKIQGFTSGSFCFGNNCFGLIAYRLLPNGTLDPSYKNGGAFVLPIQSNSDPVEVRRMPDNSFMIGGTGNHTMYALRMKANGELDTSFGVDGKIITPIIGTGSSFVYNKGFELYGNSIVLFGIYSIWYGAQTKYVGTARKYFFSSNNLATTDPEKSSDKIKIYPNPVGNNLQFTSNVPVNGFEIYDMNGKRIMHSATPVKNNFINVNALNSGNYILKLETSKEVITAKFIKE
ncbi:T9SS type A sorting domain-containing protein [Chryseobacterium sp. JM1]|uniref:T9SS type A sorting domain-containing protein n=1 Tax=Chryseobacterium sp. JM1 TaxID=1233950 RepID=UPI0004E763EA|nr:T9SS type A sorting domain-containing protein [Chryseobacterium sp. JM1]KFF16990.1 hypothetical protein IW22_21630 [Chryseobacterium sp. JM1]